MPGMAGGSSMTDSIAQRRSRTLPLRVTGASGSPIEAMMSSLTAQAARYSARSVRNDTAGATTIDR